jgi:SAM-dependent methyltransferase
LHKEVKLFLRKVKRRFPKSFVDCKVLELGSLDDNGTPRPFFRNCEYVGVDWRAGPCVDIVSFVHDLGFGDATFDTVVSTEMLEHDRFAEQSFLTGFRFLKPGGLLVFTCANEKRPKHRLEHGFQNYYEGVTKQQLLGWCSKCEFASLFVEEEDADLRGWIKK